MAPFFHRKDYDTTKNVRGSRKRCQRTTHWIFIPFLIVQNKFQMSTLHSELYNPFALKISLLFYEIPSHFTQEASITFLTFYIVSCFSSMHSLLIHGQQRPCLISWPSSSAVFLWMQLTLIFSVVHLPLYWTSSGPIYHKNQTIIYFLAKLETLSPTICGTCYGEVR